MREPRGETMIPPERSDPGKSTERRGRLIVPAVLTTLGLAVVYSVWGPSWLGSLMGRITPLAKRSLAPNPSYRNTLPGVRYVGDAVCARCHAEIAQAYHNHPMGRSLDRVRPATLPHTHSPSLQA